MGTSNQVLPRLSDLISILAVALLASASSSHATESSALLLQQLDTGERLTLDEGEEGEYYFEHDFAGAVAGWSAYDGNDDEIFVADVNQRRVQQITDNATTDTFPKVSGDCVAWVGYDADELDAEIFLSCATPQGKSVQQLTEDDLADGAFFYSPYLTFKWPLLVWVKCLAFQTPSSFCSQSQLLIYDVEDAEFIDTGCSDGSGSRVGLVVPQIDPPYVAGDGILNVETKACIEPLPGIAVAIEFPWVVLKEDKDIDCTPSYTVGSMELHLYNLETKSLVEGITNSISIQPPRINQGRVVWAEAGKPCEEAEDNEIKLLDLNTMQEISVPPIPDDHADEYSPDIHGLDVVYERVFDGADSEIVHYRVDTGNESQLTNNGSDDLLPEIENSVVVWVPEPCSNVSRALALAVVVLLGLADSRFYRAGCRRITEPEHAGGELELTRVRGYPHTWAGDVHDAG